MMKVWFYNYVRNRCFILELNLTSWMVDLIYTGLLFFLSLSLSVFWELITRTCSRPRRNKDKAGFFLDHPVFPDVETVLDKVSERILFSSRAPWQSYLGRGNLWHNVIRLSRRCLTVLFTNRLYALLSSS